MTILGFRGVHPLMLAFFPLALTLLGLGFFALKRWPHRISPSLRRAWKLAFWGSLGLCLALFPLAKAHGKFMLLYYLGSLAWLGGLNLALCCAAWLGGAAQAPAHVPARRRVLTGAAAAAAGSVLGLTLADAQASEAGVVRERRLELSRHPLAVPGRPLRLSLLSDTHAGFFLPQAHLTQARDIAGGFAPDAILFAGDLIEYEHEALEQVRGFLKDLTAIAPVYAVLGNHDCYRDPDAVADFLSQLGVRPLRGQSVPLGGPFGRFTLCGLRDFNEPQVSWSPLKGLDPASTLCLAHNPQMGLLIPAPLSPWLTLCGHTHGGQMRLPRVGAMVNQADRRIEAGLNVVDARAICVTAGLGYSGLPVRLACPPEVANIVIA